MRKHRISIDISESIFKAIAKVAIDKGSKVKHEVEKLVAEKFGAVKK